MKDIFKWKKRNNDEKPAYKYLGLAIEFAIDLLVPIALFGYLGHLLDSVVFGKNWLFFIIGIILGIAGGIYLVVRALMRLLKESEKNDKEIAEKNISKNETNNEEEN